MDGEHLPIRSDENLIHDLYVAAASSSIAGTASAPAIQERRMGFFGFHDAAVEDAFQASHARSKVLGIAASAGASGLGALLVVLRLVRWMVGDALMQWNVPSVISVCTCSCG